MSDAIITVVLTQLTSIMEREIQQEVRLVVGVDKDIEKLKKTLQAIVHVLNDADKRQIKEEAVKDWLEKLKDASHDVDDLLDEWNTAMLKQQINRIQSPPITKKKNKVFPFIKFSCFSFNQLALRHDIAVKIKGFNERLDLIANEKDKYNFNVTMAGEEPERYRTISCIDVKEVRGREQDKNTLVSKLLCESSQAQADDRSLHIISVVGMGGMGKTTLAQLAYNCDEVKTHFDRIIWVCVSEPFDEIRVAKAIYEDIHGCAPNNFELNTILRHVRHSIVGKKFLLVLDDVWTEDPKKWEPFRNSLTNGGRGSKILVTTRNERVAKMMESTDILPLRELSDQDCWFLFSQIAFFGKSRDEKLEEIGRKIADKCKGLPLAAKTIGSLMRFKTTAEEWQNVLNSETWELKEAEKGLFPPLLLSYYDLTSAMKRCFSYCAVFPKDHKIEADNLIKLWMAHGYLNTKKETVDMEVTGREYLQNLAMRSFFQDLEKDKNGDVIIRFKMHDMVHDFAKFLTKNEFFIMEVKSGTELKIDSTCKDARHSTLVRVEEAPFPTPICNTEKLHSFWVQSFYDSPPIVSEIDIVAPDSFSRLRCLKSLDLSRNRLDRLPQGVGELIKLRYLNLSHNPLSELPEKVCDLCNLQTLKLVACDQLRRLPQGMWKLISLRHLEIDRTDSLRMLPKGIGSLNSLRTLTKFVIGGGGDSEEATCKLADLKNLNFLKGHLKIEGLGYVADAGEVEKAELKNKKDLLGLHLYFNSPVPAGGMTDVEALQLHPNLQYLQIKFYVGTQFPNWLMSLTNLQELCLQECQNCVGLPYLGKLPALEKLQIEGMHSLKYASLELLGRGTDNVNHNGGSTMMHGAMAASSSSVIILFPKLKKLKIVCMNSWEEWDEISARGEAQEEIKIMPYLRCLKLSHCDKLKALPNRLLQMAPLKKLRIHNCTILRRRYQKLIGEDWSKISHIRKVRIS
ncbi:putative disease resistance protein RGA3 [Cornus florida]|uniref:putative disease resistance protein RGA3 n=1 Tax=Cornus florida TaxID=4283 RepID=UPI00289E9FBB|nr:putative disease resistance protein RGA3 [Cornus florida]XP_059640479.1 putative disease resistance protein RGA3 [Cornus florida]XP_059640480.1 putative disease resistance protein RGA3 [Cornus florida]XP_059640481.1 putative disease resistance protein RGA3 [Cornus florida]XP_059640482.1 putative disease resistance protein RGA3 [Cornus florida]